MTEVELRDILFAFRDCDSVLLAGSHARGDADEWSDVDLWVLGEEGEEPRTSYKASRLVVVTTYAFHELTNDLQEPGKAPFVVPGLRQAIVLHDPYGIGAEFKAKAEGWDWKSLEWRIPHWLPRKLLGMLEDAHKVAGALVARDYERGYDPLQVLIFGCAETMVVARRLLIETQNRLFITVMNEVGPDHPWSRALETATGIDGVSNSIGARLLASLDLYKQTIALTFDQFPEDPDLDAALSRLP